MPIPSIIANEQIAAMHETAHRLRKTVARLNADYSAAALERDQLRSELATFISKYESAKS